LEKPLKLSPPRDKEGINLFEYGRENINNQPWEAFCDRNDDLGKQTYSDASFNSKKFKKLSYLEQYWIVDERNNWVHLVQGRRTSDTKLDKNSIEDFGWILKSNVLLWNESLISNITGIHKKAFILNKFDELPSVLRLEEFLDKAPIFDSPNSKQSVGQIRRYQYFFILKKEKDRYLIAKEIKFSSVNAENIIVGWVNKSRCEDWETRISMEPNFEKPAFDERKENNSLRLALYKNSSGAKDHASNGTIDDPMWDKDPAFFNWPDEMLIKNRFRGDLTRFPKLAEQQAGPYWRTGLLGDVYLVNEAGQTTSISNTKDSQLRKVFNTLSKRLSRVNILFLIEATSESSKFKSTIRDGIAQAMDQLQYSNNLPDDIRYSLVLYRDNIPTDQLSIKKVNLSTNKELLLNTIEQFEFTNDYNDTDPFTNMNCAFQQGLEHTNLMSGDRALHIVINIGQNADFTQSPGREINKNTACSYNDFMDELTRFGAHTIFIQNKSDGLYAQNRYVRLAQEYMLENANRRFESYKTIERNFQQKNLSNPKIIAIDNTPNQYQTYESSVSNFLWLPENGILNTNSLSDYLVEKIEVIYEKPLRAYRDLKKVFDEGLSLDDLVQNVDATSESYSLGAYHGIMDLLKEMNLTQDDIQLLSNKRFQLYREAYMPKYVPGSTYPPHKFVLFMPESDLRSYSELLKNIVVKRSASIDEIREALWRASCKLVEYFSVEDQDCETLSSLDLRLMIQGLQGTGVQLQKEWDYEIADLKKKRKMSDERILDLHNRFIQMNESINDILDQGSEYPFSYESPAIEQKDRVTYFYIPLDLVF
jgi:hypothetical protein